MHTRISAIAAILLCALTIRAAAQEFCVTCTAPDATYRCVIGGDATAAARSSRGQLLCITELAQSGHHASCSAARGQATPCPGETRTVMFPAGDDLGSPPLVEAPAAPTAPSVGIAPPPAAAGPGQQQAQPPSPHEPQAIQAPTEAQPKTVEELAKKTGEAVTDTAQSAGNAVGNAMKKTWTCITSLFGNC
jgi:hypothetical protein